VAEAISVASGEDCSLEMALERCMAMTVTTSCQVVIELFQVRAAQRHHHHQTAESDFEETDNTGSEKRSPYFISGTQQ